MGDYTLKKKNIHNHEGPDYKTIFLKFRWDVYVSVESDVDSRCICGKENMKMTNYRLEQLNSSSLFTYTIMWLSHVEIKYDHASHHCIQSTLSPNACQGCDKRQGRRGKEAWTCYTVSDMLHPHVPLTYLVVTTSSSLYSRIFRSAVATFSQEGVG